ncbi:hypothetical protein F52700_11608 [Fusarium sp. NRRL 52700]|nr:hypothetical protein F52700_11608 [Fusarium sp. NRRL 52700]
MRHSHESSTQELPEQRPEHPSPDASKQMVNSQTSVDKESKVDAISTPQVTSSDPSPNFQASIADEDSMPSSGDDSHSSSPIVSSPRSSLSPKRKTCSDALDKEEPSPKKSQTSANYTTREHPSTTDILACLHAIYPILSNTPIL